MRANRLFSKLSMVLSSYRKKTKNWLHDLVVLKYTRISEKFGNACYVNIPLQAHT